MEKIYDEYYYKIFNFAIKKTNNKEDAEDLTNNIFLALLTYFNKDIKIAKLDNLIWKIAHNTWASRAQKYLKEKNIVPYNNSYELSSDEDILDKVIYKEIISSINNIGLTQKEEQCFKLYYLNDLSIKEISTKLETSISNIKYYLYSARNKIKERYNGEN